jgi:hypothetical protein
MTEHELTALGFVSHEDGTLVAPGDSDITLAPTDGNFYRLTISLADGTSVMAVLSKAALKLDREDRAHD